MVALRTKQAEMSQWEYVSSAMDAMTLDGDAHGSFASVPSQSGPFRHQVRFIEPAKGKPEVTHCSCQGFKFRRHCIHCDIVNLYFEMIYDWKNAPIEEAPVVLAPVAKPAKKVRRSARRVEIIAELQVAEGVKVRKRRGGGLAVKRPINAPSMLPMCPQIGRDLAQVA